VLGRSGDAFGLLANLCSAPVGMALEPHDLARSHKIGREKRRFYAIFCHVLAENGGICYDSAQKEGPQKGPVFKYALEARRKHG